VTCTHDEPVTREYPVTGDSAAESGEYVVNVAPGVALAQDLSAKKSAHLALEVPPGLPHWNAQITQFSRFIGAIL